MRQEKGKKGQDVLSVGRFGLHSSLVKFVVFIKMCLGFRPNRLSCEELCLVLSAMSHVQLLVVVLTSSECDFVCNKAYAAAPHEQVVNVL